MRLALDARNIYRPNRRGTGKNLIDLYRLLATIRPSWRFLMFHQIDGPDDPFAELPNVETRRIDIKGDRLDLWQQIRLPLAAKWAGADILHCPANTAPRHPLIPMVVTIHDLIGLESDNISPYRPKWARTMKKSAEKARRIVTPSEYSKRQIVKHLGITTDKVIVNHWAADIRCRKVIDSAELDRVRVKYGKHAGRRFVLAFGATDTRKNTRRIIDAWAELSDRQRSDFALVLIGIDEPALTMLGKKVADLGLRNSCFLHGFADEQDIPALISAASVLCYPSLSEGFGLPILDAFVCETAVLTSTTSSLPEVAGDAAILVDPEDRHAIAEGLAELLEDQARRGELIDRGLRRLERFTWQACAERICRVFEDVLEELG